jgi:UDP-glucose 4-epimerase
MNDLGRTYSKRRVLITGGLGFIGSNLACRLVALGAKVTVIDALFACCGGNRFNVHEVEDDVRVHVADAGDAGVIDELVKGQDFIFNLAGHVSHVDSLADPQRDLEINCRGPLAVLNACRVHNPSAAVLFAGTRGQYGRAVQLPVTEDHPLNPIDINGVHKTAAESYHILYHRLYGLRTCSLRLTNTFGPRHTMKNGRQGFLSWFIRLAMDKCPISIYDDGRQLRDFNYVDDVVEAMLRAAATEGAFGRAFNLGSGRPRSVLESGEAVISACGGGSIRHVSYPKDRRAVEVGDYWADYSLFKSVTGWEPATDFHDGLARTVAFYREHRRHYWRSDDGAVS